METKNFNDKEEFGEMTLERSSLRTQEPEKEEVKQETAIEETAKEEVAEETKEEVTEQKEETTEEKKEEKPDLSGELNTWKEKASTYEQEIEKYKTQLTELSAPKNPFEGDEDGALFYKLTQIKKTNPELYPLLKEVAIGNPDNMTLWKQNFLRDNPEFKDQPDVVQRMLERKYPALFDAEVSHDEQEYKDQLLDLTIEAKKIKKSFLATLEGVKLPESVDPKAKEERIKSERETLVKSWKSDFEKLPTEVSKKSFDVALNSKEKMTLEIEIPKEKQEELFKKAAFYVLSQNLANSPDNVKKVQDFIWREYKADNFEAETSKIVVAALKKRDAGWNKITGGKTPVGSTNAEARGVFSGEADFLDKATKKQH